MVLPQQQQETSNDEERTYEEQQSNSDYEGQQSNSDYATYQDRRPSSGGPTLSEAQAHNELDNGAVENGAAEDDFEYGADEFKFGSEGQAGHYGMATAGEFGVPPGHDDDGEEDSKTVSESDGAGAEEMWDGDADEQYYGANLEAYDEQPAPQGEGTQSREERRETGPMAQGPAVQDNAQRRASVATDATQDYSEEGMACVARVMESYGGEGLTIHAGEIIRVEVGEPGSWWYAYKENGEEGWIPGDFIEVQMGGSEADSSSDREDEREVMKKACEQTMEQLRQAQEVLDEFECYTPEQRADLKVRLMGARLTSAIQQSALRDFSDPVAQVQADSAMDYATTCEQEYVEMQQMMIVRQQLLQERDSAKLVAQSTLTEYRAMGLRGC